MKTLITHLLILMVSLSSFHGLGKIAIDDSDSGVSPHTMQSAVHEQNDASNSFSCHQVKEVMQHHCCGNDTDSTNQHQHETQDCSHDGCIECSVNCSSGGFALLPSVKTPANNAFDSGLGSSAKLPPSPYLEQVIPPIV